LNSFKESIKRFLTRGLDFVPRVIEFEDSGSMFVVEKL